MILQVSVANNAFFPFSLMRTTHAVWNYNLFSLMVEKIKNKKLIFFWLLRSTAKSYHGISLLLHINKASDCCLSIVPENCCISSVVP